MLRLMAISFACLCVASLLFTIVMCVVIWHDSFKK